MINAKNCKKSDKFLQFLAFFMREIAKITRISCFFTFLTFLAKVNYRISHCNMIFCKKLRCCISHFFAFLHYRKNLLSHMLSFRIWIFGNRSTNVQCLSSKSLYYLNVITFLFCRGITYFILVLQG